MCDETSGAATFVPPYERQLGFVFQDLALWPHLTVRKDLRAVLRGKLRRLQRALRLTTVYVRHDREDTAVLAGRVVEMRVGRIVAVHEANHQEHS